MVTSARYSGYVVELLRHYFPLWKAQKDHALAMDPYVTGRHPLPIAAKGQTKAEQDQLREIARTPYGTLIINSCVQAMKVTGIRSADDSEMPDIWRNLWTKNRMGARQVGIIKPAIAYGLSYSSILPGEHALDTIKRNSTTRGMATGVRALPHDRDDVGADVGQRGSVVWKNYSPKTMTAFFAEPQDQFPIVALNGIEQIDAEGPYLLFEVFDDEAVHYAVVRDIHSIDTSSLRVQYLESNPHGFGVTPVISHSPVMDDEGGSTGELTPFLPILHRLDQDAYDRLLIQRQAAWNVRTAAGVKKPAGASAQAAMEARMKAGDLMVSEDPNTKFGTLPPSPMGDHVSARAADLSDLSATSQTPSYMLEGLDGSMQPEALAAITSGYYAKIEGYQDSIGESIELGFRLASHVDPSIGDVGEFAEVRWKGFRPYSLTQVADALGKLAQQLQVPVDMLFEQVPFFTDEDVKRAINGREEQQQQQMEEQMALAKEQAAAAPGQPGGGRPGYSAGRPKPSPTGGNSAAQNKR